MKKPILLRIFAALGLLMLILDSKTAILGAQDAITLCIGSVIPSLFPFIVLTNLMISGLSAAATPLLRPLGKLLGIPAGAEGLFLAGILGGYPTGAQNIHQAWCRGQLSDSDAQRMLGFCNNAGPAFLFGILAPFFSSAVTLWMLWGIHILSAIITGIFLSGRSDGRIKAVQGCKPSLTASLKRGVVVMGYVCGWVVLFRILFAFCSRWILWIFPIEGQVSIYGFMELAGGCCNLNLVADESIRFIICSAMLAWGGLCVAMQTASVTGKLGLGQYLPGKGMQTIVSIWLSICVVTWGSNSFLPTLLVPPALVGIRFALRKKTVAFHGKMVYNPARNHAKG